MQNIFFFLIFTVFSEVVLPIFGRVFSQFNIHTLYFSPTFIQDLTYCKVLVVTNKGIPV